MGDVERAGLVKWTSRPSLLDCYRALELLSERVGKAGPGSVSFE